MLVIGGGNSACDIAAEAARVGEKSILSLRESVWFIPKSFAGVPIVDLIQHGRLVPKPAIDRLEGHQAYFVDGSAETQTNQKYGSFENQPVAATQNTEPLTVY